MQPTDAGDEESGMMPSRPLTLFLLALMVVGTLVALGSGWLLAKEPRVQEGYALATGDAALIRGADPFAISQAAPTSGRLEVRTVDQGGRWSAVESKDQISLAAEFVHPQDGGTYRVVMETPMRQEPEGRWTTWFGVSYGHAHHGNTGIDTPALPRVAAELAVWGFADVFRNGQPVASGKPAHMMVVKRDQGDLPGQVFLSVATEKKDLESVPDRYLNVVWQRVDTLSTPATHDIDHASTRQSEGALRPAHNAADLFTYGRRELLGYAVLVFVLAALLLLVRQPWPLDPHNART
jgi:hypothetical protein